MTTVTKRKHSSHSTVSDIDSSLDATLSGGEGIEGEGEIKSKYFEKSSENKKKDKQKQKKKKVMEIATEKSIEERLDEISNKLSNILTKDDKSFLREMIIDTIEEVRDKIFAPVVKRIEITEGEIHDLALKNETLRKEMAEFREREESMKEKIAIEREEMKERINHLEQYSRRNNIRVTGLHDRDKQSSADTANQLIRFLNEKMKTNLTTQHIDIAHRLGDYQTGRKRPVIVKFVHREVRSTVMKQAKLLKGTGVYLNDDLTKLNHEVLASIRLKSDDSVVRCWSFDGKIYKKTTDGSSVLVEFKHYAYWLQKPWPKAKKHSA